MSEMVCHCYRCGGLSFRPYKIRGDKFFCTKVCYDRYLRSERNRRYYLSWKVKNGKANDISDLEF
jgi:hypothetical protein